MSWGLTPWNKVVGCSHRISWKGSEQYKKHLPAGWSEGHVLMTDKEKSSLDQKKI